MAKQEKKVKLRLDRVLILVVALIVLIILIIMLIEGISNSGKTEPTGGDVQANVTNDISDETTTYIEETSSTSEETSQSTQEETNNSNHVVEVIDGCTYIDGILIINKSYSASPDYQGYNGGLDDTKPTPPQGLFPEVINAFNAMEADARTLGLDIYIASGYRSYYYQQNVYNRYCETDPPEVVDTYSARAGYSEHQSGYAFDLNSIDDSFADTKEGKWIAENCYKYGFIIRFPLGKEDITGYQYESWHLRYVGEEIATYMYENNLCLEEYLGVDSVYPD